MKTIINPKKGVVHERSKNMCILWKKIHSKLSNQKYCSDECARLINSDKSREYFQTVGKYKKAERKRRKQELERQRKNGMNLSEIARQVKAAGMSYAEYQKQETLERMARRA